MSSDTCQKLFVGKGETIEGGKFHFKDFIRVHIDDPKEAFTLAMDILRQIESQRHNEPRAVTFSLTGSLEPECE